MDRVNHQTEIQSEILNIKEEVNDESEEKYEALENITEVNDNNDQGEIWPKIEIKQEWHHERNFPN